MKKVFSKITYAFIIFILTVCYPFSVILASDSTYVWSDIGQEIPTSTDLTENKR